MRGVASVAAPAGILLPFQSEKGRMLSEMMSPKLVFPQMLLTFDVERPASLAAINAANRGDHLIFL